MIGYYKLKYQSMKYNTYNQQRQWPFITRELGFGGVRVFVT